MQLQSMPFAVLAIITAVHAQISAVSWADPNINVFGQADKSSLWHKFYTGWDWQPNPSFERLPAPDASLPVASSWGSGRLDVVYVNASGSNVLHKFFAGGSWQPTYDTVEDLGGDGIESVVTHSWGENRLDLVARLDDGSYVHKTWTGWDWYPSINKWESFGGEFASKPAVGSWGPGRLDIVGISSKTGGIFHMYWHEGWSKWEDLEGGPFIGSPKITSWGIGRFDIWAVYESGELGHRYWDGTKYSDWKKLGGKFESTPEVVHWSIDKIDIIGKTDDKYRLKSWDGGQWRPESGDWDTLASSYVTEPAVVAKRNINMINVLDIDEDQTLRLQLWTGYSWEPAADKTWPLGTLPKTQHDHVSSQYLSSQYVMAGEL